MNGWMECGLEICVRRGAELWRLRGSCVNWDFEANEVDFCMCAKKRYLTNNKIDIYEFAVVINQNQQRWAH